MVIRDQIKTKSMRFDYVCFACGGTNGGGCGYFPLNKDNMPWLIAHSRKPPYEVEKIEERQELQERVVEQELPTG